ncbi:MAG TPA: NAD(P)H-dependent glycerol-3-phosphate dehydrogenase [Usitatibacter sp.]|nr:NAD(P)H-dependent glycerol-3-phosphate dehydrogenase [Usitatibacter sp.]
MKIAILGAGAWGSALAISFAAAHSVRLWTRSESHLEALRRSRTSPYLPECPIADSIAVEGDLAHAIAGCDLVLVATATAGLRPVCEQVAAIDPAPRLLWACKGFEHDSRRLPHQLVAAALPRARQVGALSGPSFALEVARGLPAAVVVASADGGFARSTVDALNSQRLRLYSSTDVIGVELGGAVKNVVAIAAGICDGLKLGRNARAALITRGLAEMTRLGVALGGRAETFAGLTGLGDLVLTCTGELSRNRAVGERLASGQSLGGILDALGHVAEGVVSADSVVELAGGRSIEMPICQAVHAVLHGRLPAETAVRELLSRNPGPERSPGG